MTKPDPGPDFDFMTIDDIAELLDVQERTIRNWMKDRGMPSTMDERGRRFNWRQVLPWYVKFMAEMDGKRRNPPKVIRHDYLPDPEDGQTQSEKLFQAQFRLAVASADLKELDLAERRGHVVAIEDVGKSVDDVAKSLQTEILAWPTVMIGRVFGMRDRNQLFAVLTSSARELCQRLATLGPVEDKPDV